ncbi:MAG: hypothetical protein V4702_01410 [Patescibacteria group bacterium]
MARVRIQVPIDQSKQQVAAAEPSLVVPRIHGLSKNTVIMAAVALAVILGFIFLLNDRNKLKEEVQKQFTSQSSDGQTDALKYQEEIGKVVELPTDLTPSLIPVKDAKKLATENAFFKNAQNGDVVLLYVSPDKSVRAILYRPSTKKVVEATSSATVGAGTTAPVKQ